MKKFLLSLAVAISATSSYAQLIPNGDFEDPIASGALPKWTAFSAGVINTPTSITVNSQVLPSNGGARFLFMQNNSNAAIMACNKFAMGTRPNTLRFQACYLPAGADAFTIFLYMTKDTGAVNKPDTILAGAVSFSGGRYPWQNLVVNLATAYKNASVPDSAFIVIRAGQFQNSALVIDDIKFSSWTSSITGVENHFEGGIELYPNPVSNEIAYVKYQLNSESNIRMEIYDMQGKLVKSIFEGFETAGVYNKEIDLSGLNSGMYTCKIVADDQVNVIKLIKN